MEGCQIGVGNWEWLGAHMLKKNNDILCEKLLNTETITKPDQGTLHEIL